MKKCPFCAEEIQDEAVKCKHCGSKIVTKQEIQTSRKNYLIIFLILILPAIVSKFIFYFKKEYILSAEVAGVLTLVTTIALIVLNIWFGLKLFKNKIWIVVVGLLTLLPLAPWIIFFVFLDKSKEKVDSSNETEENKRERKYFKTRNIILNSLLIISISCLFLIFFNLLNEKNRILKSDFPKIISMNFQSFEDNGCWQIFWKFDQDVGNVWPSSKWGDYKTCYLKIEDQNNKEIVPLSWWNWVQTEGEACYYLKNKEKGEKFTLQVVCPDKKSKEFSFYKK